MFGAGHPHKCRVRHHPSASGHHQKLNVYTLALDMINVKGAENSNFQIKHHILFSDAIHCFSLLPSEGCPALPTDIQWYNGSLKMFCFRISICQVCIPSHATLRDCPTRRNNGTLWDFGTVPNCSSHCTMGRIDTMGTVSHCTNGGIRWTGSSQFIPICFAVSTVHPIPLFNGREWTDWHRPIVPWKGLTECTINLEHKICNW